MTWTWTTNYGEDPARGPHWYGLVSTVKPDGRRRVREVSRLLNE